MYLNGRAIPTQGGGNQNLELQGEIGVDNPLLLWAPTLPDGAISDFHIFNRVLSESEARLLHEWPRIDSALPWPTFGRSDRRGSRGSAHLVSW